MLDDCSQGFEINLCLHESMQIDHLTRLMLFFTNGVQKQWLKGCPR